MENKTNLFQFKTQPCTTPEQSARLVKLGVHPETADFIYYRKEEQLPELDILLGVPFVRKGEEPLIFGAPAWSLHRLMAMLQEDLNLSELNIDEAYDWVITRIKVSIEEEEFNQQYLFTE